MLVVVNVLLVWDISTVSPVFRSMENRPHNRNVTNGDTVTIFCKAAAEPKATVVWYKNGKPLDRTFILCVCNLASVIVKSRDV